MKTSAFLPKIGVLVFISLIFLLGWTISSLVANAGELNTENPFSEGLFRAKEVSSPFDHVKKDQIQVFEDKVILQVPNVIWAEFTDTNSMDPLLDINSNSLEIKPVWPTDIHKGDIITYKPRTKDFLVIHRVVETGIDADGWYCKTKGDNLNIEDPEKIRFNQVNSVVIGIIY